MTFEKLRLNFEEKIKGSEKKELRQTMQSPSLMRLMQLNEKKLSESLKTKNEKIVQKKKLKQFEEETKMKKELTDRKRVRDIQMMFDRLSKNNSKDETAQNQKPLSKPPLEPSQKIGQKLKK